jgi:hypothetical protein
MSEAMLLAALDAVASAGRTIDLWLRDDDAVSDTARLRRLAALADRHDISVLVAVIPAKADATLAALLAETPRLLPCQHGFAHQDHLAGLGKKTELAEERGIDTVLQELRAGAERLAALLPAPALPVLVPPWNRIGDGIAARLDECGFRALSGFGRALKSVGPLPTLNTHVDLMHWGEQKRGKDASTVLAELAAEVHRAHADDRRIGLLAHHLVHDQIAWESLGQALQCLRHHPAARWPSPCALLSPEV